MQRVYNVRRHNGREQEREREREVKSKQREVMEATILPAGVGCDGGWVNSVSSSIKLLIVRSLACSRTLDLRTSLSLYI